MKDDTKGNKESNRLLITQESIQRELKGTAGAYCITSLAANS